MRRRLRDQRPLLANAFHGPEIRRGACVGQRNANCDAAQVGYDRDMQIRFHEAFQHVKALLILERP